MSGGPAAQWTVSLKPPALWIQVHKDFPLVSAALNVFIHDPLALSSGQSLELQTGFLNGQREDSLSKEASYPITKSRKGMGVGGGTRWTLTRALILGTGSTCEGKEAGVRRRSQAVLRCHKRLRLTFQRILKMG